MNFIQLTDDTFEKEIVENGGKCFVDFFATWCMPCKMMEPTLKRFAEENGDVRVYQVDIDKSPELVGKFDIQSVPTFISFDGGKQKNMKVGVCGIEDLTEMV